eukprot:scaffold7446_cov403-Prasinococcus_capsulatus_cf.AAC.2
MLFPRLPSAQQVVSPRPARVYRQPGKPGSSKAPAEYRREGNRTPRASPMPRTPLPRPAIHPSIHPSIDAGVTATLRRARGPACGAAGSARAASGERRCC